MSALPRPREHPVSHHGRELAGVLGGHDVVVAVEPECRTLADEAPHGRSQLAVRRLEVDHLGLEARSLHEVDEGADTLRICAARRVLGRDLDQSASRRDEVGAACGDPAADVGCCCGRHGRPMAIGSPPRGVSETALANTIQRCEAE